MTSGRGRWRLVVGACVVGIASASGAAQPATAPAAPEAPATADQPSFKPEELEQMLAPIALYPDSLISQILMASTYPLEIVEADRWVKQKKEVKSDADAKELEEKDWDASVKSLTNFPDVLAMLSEKLDWTQKIGDAFIGQQKEVMDTVQKLRGKAKDAGKLESSKEQNVKVEQQGGSQTIVIESSSPDVVYVPSYNTTVVYGAWPYPAYPPYPYHPPGYVASNLLSFGAGVACGLAWGYAWGNCNWGGGDVDIDVNRNVNRNTNINRSKYNRNVQGGRGGWQHDGAHRRGVGYRNQSTAQRFGGASNAQAAKSREAFRGRAEQGRSDIAREGADRVNREAGAANRAGAGAGTRDAGAERSGALDGAKRSGTSERAASKRGNQSRSAPARTGGGRSGGGGRGGGGRR